MKKIIILIVIILIPTIGVFSQENFIFNFDEDHNTDYYVLNLKKISDTYYAFIATDKNEYKCLKIDSNGNLIDNIELNDQTEYTLKDNQTFISVELQNIQDNFTSFDIVISELNLNFEVINTKVINFNNPYITNRLYYFISKPIYNPENELVFNLNFYDYGFFYDNEVFVFKLDQDYKISNSKFFDSSSKLFPVDMEYIPQSKGYIITSFGNPIFPSEEDAGFYRLDKDFNVEKIHTYTEYNGASNFHYAAYLKFITDSTFVTNAIRFNGTSADEDMIELIKTDTTFQILKSVKIGFEHGKHSAASSNGLDLIDNNAIFFGGSKSYNYSVPPPYYLIISKVDNELSIIWEKFIEYDNTAVLNYILATDDGACVIAGTIAHSNNSTGSYIEIIKLDSDGNYQTAGINEKKVIELFLYPNPGNDVLQLRTAVQQTGGIFYMYDIAGKEIFSQQINSTLTQINTNDLPSGAYIFKYINKNSVIESGKWIKN